MQKSKYHNAFPEIDAFVKKNKDNLDECTYSKFKAAYPKIKLSYAAYYARRRKALGLPSYAENKKLNGSARTVRRTEKLYKQFFSVPKKETTEAGIKLLSQFLDRMNHSNYNSHFEMIEIIPKTTDGNNEAIIEVREYK